MKIQRKPEDALHRQVSELRYSRTDNLSDEVFGETLAELKKLWTQYGYARVLGELSRQWSIEKALAFFEKMEWNAAKPKNIRTIGTSYHRGYNGGVERVQAQLMTLWVNMGYRVVLFSEEPANPLDFSYPSSVNRILIPKTTDMSERLLALQKGIEEEGVDVLVNHDWSNCAALWEVMLLKMMDVAYVTHVHNQFGRAFINGKPGIYLPRIFQMSDVVVALSESSARFFQLCGCKTYLVENPIPEDLRQIKELAPLNSRSVLMVGRIAAQKNPMEAIRAFKLAHDACPDAVFDVVGADSEGYMGRMARYCAENGITSSVTFHGAKNNEEVSRFYRDSACVLLTSKTEGYPMVLLEAKAHGVPIAMYDQSYLTLVKDKRGIMTAPAGDVRGVADNIIRLLRDDKLRQDCGRAAREDFELHSAYDFSHVWTDIFTLCENSETVNAKAYFDPASVTEADQFIIPQFLDAIEKSYDNLLNQSVDYRVGKKLLRVPRKLKHMLKKLKGMVLDT